MTCALALTACGGSDDDVDTILSETFGEGKEVKSGRLDLALRLNAQGLQGLQGPASIQLNGPFASTKAGDLPRFDFTASIDAGGQKLSAGAVSTGDRGFIKFQDQPYAVSDQLFAEFRKGYAEQAKCSEEAGDKGGGVSFSSLGVRPSRWLADAEKNGEQEVGGAETDRISGRVDVPRFLEDVNRILSRTNPQQADPCAEEGEQPEQPSGQQPRQLSEADRKQISDAIKDAKVDIWTGKDDRIMRRINVTLKFEVPEGQRAQANGLSAGDVRFDMTIGALNEEQTINAPQNSKPLEELIAQFGGSVPGVGGTSEGGQIPGQGQGTSGGASSGSAYDRCLAAAGQDVAKLQECQALVGQ